VKAIKESHLTALYDCDERLRNTLSLPLEWDAVLYRPKSGVECMDFVEQVHHEYIQIENEDYIYCSFQSGQQNERTIRKKTDGCT